MFFNIKNSKIFFLSLFLILWAAINSKAYDILYFYIDITNLTYFINFLRSIGPSIILFFLLIFILKNFFSKKNFIKNIILFYFFL